MRADFLTRAKSGALKTVLLGSLLVSGSSLILADDLDDMLGAFDEEDELLVDENVFSSDEEDSDKKSIGDLTGSLVFNTAYNYLDHRSSTGTNYHGLSKLRTQLNLQYDYDITKNWKVRASAFAYYDWVYDIHEDRDYSDEVLDDYKWEAEFRELWVRGSLSESIDLKVGRQVVNWGRSETLRVLDVLNPLDNREIGLADIENLRLPVGMIKGDYYFSGWNLSLIALPETRFSKNPSYGSDFYSSGSDIEEKEPSDVDGTGWAAAMAGVFSGWDIAFHAARVWNDTPYLRPFFAVPGSPYDVELRHSRINMVGTGGNYSFGSWLFKGELGAFGDVDYTVSTGSGEIVLPTGTVEKDRLDLMFGIEYYGLSDTVFTLDIVNRHIFDYDPAMEPFFYMQEDQLETSLRYDGNFINDRLTVTALVIVFGDHAQNGSIFRFVGEYELRDSLAISAGLLTYQEGDPPPFDGIEDNDRLFGELKWSF